jgi:hypothetical protein
MISGSSLNKACTGKTSNLYFYTGTSFTNGTVLYTDQLLTTFAPAGNGGSSNFYYAQTWNTIYYINTSDGKAYDTGETCSGPTGNPWTSIGITYSTANSDGACCSPMFTSLTIQGYGGDSIINCSMLHDLPQAITSDNPTNFWLSDGIYVQGFQYNGTNHTATPIGPSSFCPTC